MKEQSRVKAGESRGSRDHADEIDTMEAGSKSGEDGKVIAHFVSVLEIGLLEWILIRKDVPWLNPMPKA